MGNKKLRSLILLLFILAAVSSLMIIPAYSQSNAFIFTVKSDMFYPLNNVTIYIDGVQYAQTDANGVATTYNFPNGTHNVTAVKEGYINKTVTKEFVASGSIDFILKNQPVVRSHNDSMTIFVCESNEAKSLVAGAMVYIDGKYVGTTDNYYGEFVSDAPPGQHEVVVYKEGMVNSSISIDFTKGGNYTILLSPNGRTLSIFNVNLLISSFIKVLANGAINTIQLSVIAFAIGIMIGLVMGMGRVSPNRVYRTIASVYVEGIRGLPLLLQVLFINYAVPFLYMDVTGNVLPLNAFTACIVALSMNSGSYMGEIFKAGIEAIHKGQMEAARSLGMSYNQSMRSVILPQAFKIVLPALGNEFIALIKDSSIAMVISYQEMLWWSKEIGAETYNSFTPILAAGIIYLCITIPLGRGVQYMEKRMNTNIANPREKGSGWLGIGRKKEKLRESDPVIKEAEYER